MNKIFNHEPPLNCNKCSRLFNYRQSIKFKYPSWHNRPVKSFGSINSKILIVGLAPGKKGANRTGRPFTGDGAGETLYHALIKNKLAFGTYDPNGKDDLKLESCRITNLVRCVPPFNKPSAKEFSNCKSYLTNEIERMKKLKIIFTLGRDAYFTILKLYNLSKSKNNFYHKIKIPLPDNRLLIGSYHCSQYNINTKRLTVKMFDEAINELNLI